MKFLCVECDEQMQLQGTEGPDRGSMTVLFECGACGKQTAMLTNSMETQMVSSLGVSIGGRASTPEPMEMLRSSLITEDEEAVADRSTSTSPAPHEQQAHDSASQHQTTGESGSAAESSGDGASKCPFTGMVNEAMSAPGLEWTDEALQRMERIPAFVRPMVQRGIEDHARAKGLTQIDRDVLEAVRGEIGM